MKDIAEERIPVVKLESNECEVNLLNWSMGGQWTPTGDPDLIWLNG